jgi:uncharacterized protein
MNYAELKSHQKIIHQIAEKYVATRIRVFGSVARGDTDEKSDVDFLINLEENRSLFDLGGLQFDLQKSLAVSVDVVTESGIKEDMRQQVLAEAKEI